ncbi:MAG TPA: hypothetical protein VEB59_11295 [Gemmatimonadales bacterium]|nr:hypothetical protein [Gemmatimonadales bacterium]
MSDDYRPSIEQIAAESGITIEQARKALTAGLRSLHRTAVTHQEGVTAALMQSYFCFGGEACFHVFGLLEEARMNCDADLPWSETMERFAPQLRPYASVVERWLHDRDRPPDLPGTTPTQST